MSKLSLAIFFALGLTVSRATPAIKSWKVFRNDNGYELKVPDCWKTQIDNPDESGVITAAKHVFISELASCQRPRLDSEIPNGISIGVWGSFKSKVELNSNTEKVTKWVTSGTNKNLGVRKFRVGDADAIQYVEVVRSDFVRWKTNVFCGPRTILEISGPSLKDSSPVYIEYMKKLKSGDITPPEPEKTILASIKCTQSGEK
jgi:hypothetical protein